jgi:hypothetical protein
MTNRAKHWAGLLTAWQRSGLSQVEYCRRQGINDGTFAWWKRQLRGAVGPARHGVRAEPDGVRPGGRSDFVEVAWPPASVADGPVSPGALPAGFCGYEIALANGRAIRLPRVFDVAVVARLIAAVESC